MPRIRPQVKGFDTSRETFLKAYAEEDDNLIVEAEPTDAEGMQEEMREYVKWENNPKKEDDPA